MIPFKQILSIKFIIPLCLIIIIGLIFAEGLQRDPSELPSVMIDKPLPSLNLPNLLTNKTENLNQALQGQVTLLSIWATWCNVCLVELPALKQLAEQPEVHLQSIVYKDSRSRALKWLAQYGNPFTDVWLDETGEAAIELGVYGTPELYLIDQHGKIRYRHSGAITEKLIKKQILPLVNQLNQHA